VVVISVSFAEAGYRTLDVLGVESRVRRGPEVRLPWR
jgi:hypothetical protein